MGTRSLIAKQTGPDTYRAVFCQLDGHLESQGAIRNMITIDFARINMPHFEMVLIGAAISAIGLGIGTAFNRRKAKRN